MEVTSAQFAQLVSAFGKNQTDALIQFLAAKFQSAAAATSEVTNAVGTPEPISVTPLELSLDTDIIISTTRLAIVVYTVELSVAANTAGVNNDDAMVSLMVGGQEVSSSKNAISATITAILGLLGFSISSSTNRWAVAGFVRAGETVRLVSSGSGNMSVISGQGLLL